MSLRPMLRPLLVLTAALGLAPAQAHELQRVYERALSQDTQLRAALHARDAALEARPQARAALLPQLNGSYGYQDQRETGTEGASFGGGTEFPVDRDSISKALTVTLDQTLFDWTAFSRYGQAGHEVALAHAQYRGAEQDLLLRTAEAYFGLLAAADSLRLAQAEKAAVARQLDQAQRRFDVGLSAITDVQEAQARHDLTLAQEISAQQQLAMAREALAEITGESDARGVPLREQIPLRLPDPANVDPWLSTAREKNVQLASAQIRAKIAGSGIDIARGGHLPTVAAQAQYQDAETQGGRFVGELETETLGVFVRVPIFAGLATRSRVQQAQATQAQVEALREGTQRAVERRTRDAFLAVQTGVARVQALQQAVASSTTALDASQTGLDVGTRTSVDVLNAQRDLYGAQRDLSRARYDYLLAVLRLKQAAGTLGAADLMEIDALLESTP